MKLKMITGVMVMLILMSMLTIAFNLPPILADAGTAELPDDNSTVQKADGGKPLNLTDCHESFVSEGLNRNTSAKENTNLYSVDEDKWNFNKINEWTDFAKVDDDSAELVIGVNDRKPNGYVGILGLIGENGGDLVGDVSIGGEIRAVVADIPLGAISSFTTEVRDAGLSSYIEPNMKFQACFVPDDTYWSYQWGPRIIEADYAWNTTLGDPSVLVAVIDTGIDWNHPDLAANYVALGYDWVNDDPDPMDDEGHGTHCAGIIAAVINNSIGVAGLVHVKIMAEKGLDSGGSGTEDDLANAIIHAVDQGADILSNSWGAYGESELIHEAVRYAYDAGVLMIAAAGNEATSNKLYPAAYDEVIAVTATDEYDNPASFPGWWGTNFGDWVELAAPGVDIYSTVWDDSYTYNSGTSMATPHVAGVAALILSQFPTMTRDQVRLQLRFTADDLGDPGFDDYYGYGRINARKAVEQAPPDHDLLILNWETPLFVEPGGLAVVNTTVFNFGTSNETDITVQLFVNGSIVDSATIGFLETATSETVNCSWTPAVEGTYNLTSYVVPVLDEIFTANNFVTAMVRVGYFKYVLFDQTHGTDNIVMYNTLVTALTERDYVVDVHTSGSITSGVLMGCDAFVIPQAHDPYTSIELAAMQNFVVAGGGFLIIGDDEPYIYTGLTGFAGITWSWDGCGGDTSDITPHPATEGVTTAYFDSPMSSLYVSDPAQDLIRDPCGYIMLAASETGSGKVLGIADEHSINDYSISYADNFQLAINMIDWLALRPEHDLVVTLDHHAYVEPGESSLLNVTVHNRGLNNETDVELFLLIDDTIVNNVTVPELVTDSSYKLSYFWTPVVEGMHNVTGYAVPVQNETVPENNLAWAYVYVGFPVKAFVLDSAGTYRYDVINTWEVLNTNWYGYGSTMTYIDYATLDKDDISYDDIAATGADVLIISCASDPWMDWEFTDSEIKAITRYVMEGHGLIATAGTFYYQVPNNNKLASLFGLNETITWRATSTDLLHLQDPTHQLFVNVPNPYTFPQVGTASPSDGRWDLNELAGGTYVALGHYEESAIVVHRGLVYISSWLEIIPSYYHHHLQLLYNAITWSSFEKPEHEVIVHLESPLILKPGNATMLNATVSNMGLNNETGVELQLVINGTIVDSVVVPDLLVGSSYTVSYLWTPTVEGTYNITVYAPPLPDEEFIENNVESASVIVYYTLVALFKNVDPWDNPSNEVALSLHGIPHFIFGSEDFGSIDLSLFSKVVIASDQDQTFYDAMDTYRWWFEDYVSNGGLLEIHAADWGWNGGGWIGSLPGGLQWASYGSNYVTIVDPAHPAVTIPNPITDAELDEWFASVHGYFSTYPVDSRVVIIEDDTGYPAYLEFRYGTGFVVASSQPLEWAYSHQYSVILENSLLYFKFSHELVVFLEAPAFLQPSESSLLNATVYNLGLSNETSVELKLLIDGSIVNNATIPVLLTGSSYTLSYLWTPTTIAKYNVTAYAPPVVGESVTMNNVVTKTVAVLKVVVENVLVYTDDYAVAPSERYPIVALDNLGITYTHCSEDPSGFVIALTTQTWDLVIVSHNNYYAFGNNWEELEEYVFNGGLLVLSTFDIDGSDSEPTTLWSTLGVQWFSDMSYPEPVYRWIPTHPMFTFPNTVGDLTSYIEDYYDDGDHVAATTGTPIAGFTTSPTTGYASIVVGNDNRTVLVSFSVCEFRYDEDGDRKLDTVELWENAIAFVAAPPEHDLHVTLDAPMFLEPGDSSLLNATVHNHGLSNETDVELFLLINGTEEDNATVPLLVPGESYTINCSWTPTVEATYNVTAYAPPVDGENIIVNNVRSVNVTVSYVIAYVAVLNAVEVPSYWTGGWGNDYQTLVDALIDSGFYAQAVTNEEIIAGILDYFEVFVMIDNVPNDAAVIHVYDFWSNGGGIVAFDSSICFLCYAGILPPESAGSNGYYVYWDYNTGSTAKVSTAHPVTDGYPVGQLISGQAGDAEYLVSALAGTIAYPYYTKLAEDVSISDHAYVSAYEPPSGGRAVHIWDEGHWSNTDLQRMILNAMKWASPHEHELVVSLEAPTSREPGDSSLLNATVSNRGLNNETNVELSLFINSTTVNSTTIPELLTGESYTINYLWTPTIEAIYNITAYAPPVPDENVTVNNLVTRMVDVRYITVALISDHSELLAITPILDSMGIGYDIYNDNSMYLYTEDLDLLLNYQTVIFYTDYRHITSNECTALESYLSSGGNLLVTGFDSLVSDDLLRDLIRSATMGDNVGEPDLYVVGAIHPIMNGLYGSFPAGYHISGLYGDCDTVEADTTRMAVTVAEVADGYDKIIATWRLPGKIVYWNGRGDLDWTWNVDCEAMLKNTLAWFARLVGDVNGDGKVDYEDLFLLGDAYGSRPDDDNWNPNCDFNGDGYVGWWDLFALADNYGI